MTQIPAGLIQFKAILVTHLNEKRGIEPTIIEARRFVAQVMDGVGAFSTVCGRIEEYVTSLSSKINTLYWKDEDGDFIKVTTDTEIRNAITIMLRSSDVVKIYVVQERPGHTHSTVTCDNCNVFPVRGNRYKCLTCPDFDLCGTCEARGIHTQHNMVRYADPSQRRSVSFADPLMSAASCDWKVFPKIGLKHPKLEKLMLDLESGTSSSDDDVQCVYEKRRHHKEKHNKQRKDHHHRERRERGRRLQRDLYNAACGAAQAASGIAQACASSASSAFPKKGVHFPFNLTAFLDPSGCHQQYGTATSTTTGNQAQSGPSPTASAEPASAPQQPAESMDQTAVNGEAVNAFQNLVSAAIQSAPDIANAVRHITESLAQQHVDGTADGWTMVTPDGREQSPPSSIPTQASQQEVSPTSEAARLYPDLAPTRNATASDGNAAAAVVAPPEPRHPNLLVQRSLESLIGMGFSNEGGMLTQLLEIHNGDICKALDVLQAIRK